MSFIRERHYKAKATAEGPATVERKPPKLIVKPAKVRRWTFSRQNLPGYEQNFQRGQRLHASGRLTPQPKSETETEPWLSFVLSIAVLVFVIDRHGIAYQRLTDTVESHRLRVNIDSIVAKDRVCYFSPHFDYEHEHRR